MITVPSYAGLKTMVTSRPPFLTPARTVTAVSSISERSYSSSVDRWAMTRFLAFLINVCAYRNISGVVVDSWEKRAAKFLSSSAFVHSRGDPEAGDDLLGDGQELGDSSLLL